MVFFVFSVCKIKLQLLEWLVDIKVLVNKQVKIYVGIEVVDLLYFLFYVYDCKIYMN